jgi:hypothetical protein
LSYSLQTGPLLFGLGCKSSQISVATMVRERKEVNLLGFVCSLLSQQYKYHLKTMLMQVDEILCMQFTTKTPAFIFELSN